jgi:hypothetical protein
MRGADITMMVSRPDKTRVSGLVFGSDGAVLNDIDLWVTNDNAPANRIRARTRKNGTFLLRHLDRLFTRDDVEGIVLRVLFEKDGYRSTETTVSVPKNGLGSVHVILYTNEEEPFLEELCAVVKGRLQDRKGKPVKRTRVTVSSLKGELLAETTSDGDGRYTLALWNAPEVVELEASDGTLEARVRVKLRQPENHDVLQAQILDLLLTSEAEMQ